MASSPPPGTLEGFDVRAARDAQDALGPFNARGPLPHSESPQAPDWLNFFLAALLMGFGPFVAVKLHDRPERAEQLPLPLVSVPRARPAAMAA
jgi:hypothetical protein